VTERPSADAGPQASVGSAAEEAVRLLTAAQDWARRSGWLPPDRDPAAPGAGTGSADDTGEWWSSTSASGHHGWADGSAACQHCPVCQLIVIARQASPEVGEQLAHAVESLLAAARAFVPAPPAGPGGSATRVERIDLD
jgi:hypothetical protein